MLLKKKTNLIMILLLFCCMMFLVIPLHNCMINAESKAGMTRERRQILIPVQSYELKPDTNYTYSTEVPVDGFSFGRPSMGRFYVDGDIKNTVPFRDTFALDVKGQIAFHYDYDGSNLHDIKENWNIVDDQECNFIDNELHYDIGSPIGTGALMIMKSSDGQTWYNAVNTRVDLFTSYNGSLFYTPSGEEINNGTYYQVIVAYKVGRKIGEEMFGKDKMQYVNCVEVHKFYLTFSDGAFTLHNLDKGNLSDTTVPGVSSEVLTRAETLKNDSVVSKGFTIDKLGKNMLVKVTKNGVDLGAVNHGAKFTDNGEYTISSTTHLGNTYNMHVYVFSGGQDKGFSTYFSGKHLLDSNTQRIYDKDSKIPVYKVGAVAHINKVPANTPVIGGNIKNLTTGHTDKILANRSKPVELKLNDEGTYLAEFLVGSTAAGTVFKYTFSFKLVNKVPAPVVNEQNLMNTDRVIDMDAKHYEVSYITTGGGYVFVCFDETHYKEALDYSRDIEKRFIEKPSDGDGLYYKDPVDQSSKKKYYDYIELTAQLEKYAMQNVDIAYFNPLDEFTYRSYDPELLDQLESLTLKESIRVFPSEEERQLVLGRKPYLNGFEFVKVADYETNMVQAYCYATDESIALEFGRPLSEQLTTTSRYRITEANAYGNTNIYDAYYLADNQAVINIEVTRDGAKTNEVVNLANAKAADGQYIIECDGAVFGDANNEWDEDTILTIKAPTVYTFEQKCKISELKSLSLYKAGDYIMKCIDRAGNVIDFTLRISGAESHDAIIGSLGCNYTDFYNSLHANKVANGEEIMHTKSELLNLANRVIIGENYEDESFRAYNEAVKNAKKVGNNPIATQEEINNAYIELDRAYEALVPATNRTLLGRDIIKLKALDYSLYTPESVLAFKIAYDTACHIYMDNTLEETDYKTARTNLAAAAKKLTQIANHDELKALIDKVIKVDRKLYMPDSITALETEYNSALANYKSQNMTQEQVDATTKALKSKYDALVAIGDRTKLKTIIAKVAEISPNKFTNESIKALKAKYDEAVVEVVKPHIQAEYDALANSLSELYVGLEEDTNKIKLQTLMDDIAKQNIPELNADNAKALKAKYKLASELMSSRNASSDEIRAVTADMEAILTADQEESDGMPGWEIALIVIASLAGLALVIFVIWKVLG